jgi:hypothetical protein
MSPLRFSPRSALFLFVLAGALLAHRQPVSAQEVPPVNNGLDEEAAPPNLQQEIDALLMLTREQQKQRARELIRKYPDTETARILRRVLAEHATYDALAEQERLAREARAVWVREFWRGRCCPLPAWNPPVGRIINETDEPVLYQQRIEGIHHTRWSGPYRLRAGDGHESPHPYFVRYLVQGDVQTVVVYPGDVYAFRGSPDDGTLTLVPAGAGNLRAGGAVVPPLSTEPTAPEDGAVEEPPAAEGPMIP